MQIDSTQQPVAAASVTNAPDAANPPQPVAVTQPQPAAPGAPTSQPTPQARNADVQNQPQPMAKQSDLSKTQGPDPESSQQSLTPQQQRSVQHAGFLRTLAETLAGGKRYNYVSNPDGTVTPKPVPLSKSDITLAIALEAISGSLSGLAQRGPGATGRAAAAGFQQVQQQQKDAEQRAREQAEQDAQAKSNALVRQAQVYEANSRAVLNTSEAEQRGADAIDKLVSINRASGILDADPQLLDNGGVPMTQSELMDGMKSGKLSPTDQIGPVAGRIEITNPDGSKRWEATHLVIRDPSTKVPLTQQDWDYYASQGVPGFAAGTKIGSGTQIKLSMKQIANETAAAHYLAVQRLSDLRNVLDGTPYAKQVPVTVDFTKPGVVSAMQRFQRYVSHNAQNLADPFTALQQMGADRRNPQTGEMEPNPDAKYVGTVADAFGGWSVLQSAHDQIEAQKKSAAEFAVIDSADKANAVFSAPKRFTTDQVSAARNFLVLANESGARKATQEARARAVAEGTDVQAMYRFGRNPVTGEVLSIDNAPPSMLVDNSGNVIPQDMVSTYRPTAQEKQTADTARQVLAISASLQSELQRNPNLAGPLSGRSKAAIAKLGYGDAQAQKFLDDITFLQSAATKMHTGRFSNEILRKMDGIIKPGMNDQQFIGALSSVNDVASRYADEDKLRTVADFKKQMVTPMNATPAAGKQVQIPAGARLGRDGQGRIVGYKLPNGTYVPLGGQQ